MKKRILAALLAAVILLTLAGCANNKADAPAPDTTRPTVTTTVETTGTAESDTDTEHTEEKKNSTAEETKPAETTKTQEPSESVTEQTETKPAETKPQTTEKPESESKPAETVPKETEQKPTETKPAETKPSQTEPTTPPKTEETKVTEPTETEPAVTMPTRPTASEIEPLVAKYLIFTFENVPFGRWIVREIKAAPAFVLNENSYAVTVSTDEEVIEITIENEFITGSVKTTKVDKEYPDNKLSGAVFEVYVDVDGNGEFDPEIDLFVGEMTETEDGIYEMHDLRYNGYFLYEKTAPEGFLKDDGYYYFEIRNDGETVIVENEAGVGFTNQPILGNVTTTKVDKEYPDNKLSGAVFEIYKDVDGNGEFDAEIDTLVGEMTETEAGVYFYEKLRYGGYFLYEKTAPEGFVKDDTYHYFEIRNDGETVTVENEAGVGFTNKPIVGELELTKTDISDGKVLANVGFRIRNEAGEIVAEGYTDENGIAKFTLRYGKYTYEEFAALDGYIPDTKAYPFEIKEDGEIVKAAMTNEKIPEVPQTGDESNIGFWIGLAAVALGGVIATAIVLIKKKKDDENE